MPCNGPRYMVKLTGYKLPLFVVTAKDGLNMQRGEHVKLWSIMILRMMNIFVFSC